MTIASVRWSALAKREFTAAIEYIAVEKPLAAEALAERVAARVDALADNPLIGRPGRRSGTREFVLSSTPFLVIYRAASEEVFVLRFLHGRQIWPPR